MAEPTIVRTRAGSVSDLARRFSTQSIDTNNPTGANATCAKCNKTCYAKESTVYNKLNYHNTCFKCMSCGGSLAVSTAVVVQKDTYCRTCWKKVKQIYASPDAPVSSKADSRENLPQAAEQPAQEELVKKEPEPAPEQQEQQQPTQDQPKADLESKAVITTTTTITEPDGEVNDNQVEEKLSPRADSQSSHESAPTENHSNVVQPIAYNGSLEDLATKMDQNEAAADNNKNNNKKKAPHSSRSSTSKKKKSKKRSKKKSTTHVERASQAVVKHRSRSVAGRAKAAAAAAIAIGILSPRAIATESSEDIRATSNTQPQHSRSKSRDKSSASSATRSRSITRKAAANN